MPGRAGRIAGALLVSLPLFSLLSGYAASPAGFAASLQSGNQGGTLVIVILALTSVGIAATALIARAEDLETAARLRSALEQQRLQLIDAIELGRASEARVRDAERRMELLEHGIAPVAGEDEAALRAMKDSGGALQWSLAASVGMLCLACAALYFGLYQPAARKLQVQSTQLSQLAGKHAADLSALRVDFETQKGALSATLDTERTGIASARAAVEEAEGRLAACEQAAEADADAEAVAKPPRGKAHRRTKVSRAWHTAATGRAAASAKAAALSERPGVPELDAKTRRALRDSESRRDDDPLSGL
jgi:hypothetical protein